MGQTGCSQGVRGREGWEAVGMGGTVREGDASLAKPALQPGSAARARGCRRAGAQGRAAGGFCGAGKHPFFDRVRRCADQAAKRAEGRVRRYFL